MKRTNLLIILEIKRMNEKILLLLLPFWTPLIPAVGLACLKSFLRQHGFDVKVVDVNVDGDFRDASYIDECHQVEKLHMARQITKDEGDFDF